MCGRFVGNYSVEDILADIAAASPDVHLVVDDSVTPLFRHIPDSHDQSWNSFNVAPSTMVPVLVQPEDTTGALSFVAMQWGFVPTWSKDPGKAKPMINARSETVLEKPMFRQDVAHHRCAVPMRGFYEWERSEPRAKRPYFVERTDDTLMWCLGLWSAPRFLEGLGTFALLTRQSTGALAGIHDRAPVQVRVEDALDWIAPGSPPMELCDAEMQPTLVLREVSARVNSVRNNDPSLIDFVDVDVVDTEIESRPNATLFDV